MLSSHIQTNHSSIDLDQIYPHINSYFDSKDHLEAEEINEHQKLEIQNFYHELNETYNEQIINSCESAIGNYIKGISKEKRNSQIEKFNSDNWQTHQASFPLNEVFDLFESQKKPHPCCHIIPPYLTEKLNKIDGVKNNSFNHRVNNIKGVSAKQWANLKGKIQNITPAVKQQNNSVPITVYDAKNTKNLPGNFAISNKGKAKNVDEKAKRVFESAKKIHEFWLKNFKLNSFDGKGSEIRLTVHFGKNFDNAFWNGKQLVFGDGNKNFKNLTQYSVMGHEFGHAVTGNKLNYNGEAGALNEHLSDVWGALFEQYQKKQKADKASWLIGENTLYDGTRKFPLRSMKAPGTAYNTARLGKDPQPDHYSKRYRKKDDNGGVHINSGIPNKAFYLFARAQGGYAWEKPGHVWYLTMQQKVLIHPDCSMHDFAQATLYTAMTKYPHDAKLHRDLLNAWKAVGLA